MARQPERDEPILLRLRCTECGHYLARTRSGFLACPLGHATMIREADDDPRPEDETSGLWFQDELPPAA